MSAPAIRTTQQIARPLKVLIPLIQGELQRAYVAGRAHYTSAGRMLTEAKPQVADGRWGEWLSNNFELGATQARLYMRWARIEEQNNADGVEMPLPAYAR